MDYITLVCCILAFVLYLNTLNSGFVYDDRRAILSNVDVVGNTPWKNAFIHDFWGTPLTDSGSHGSYRPLCVLSFRLNFLLGGHTAWGFHLINNMLHCFATGLVVKLARQLLSSVWGIIVTGALFAVHPIHTEAVAGIVGRADLATCACYLLAFISYIRHIIWRMENDQRQWLALMFTIMASIASLLFKETGITALLACGIFDMICSACGCKDKWRRRSLCVIISAFLCAIYVRLVLIPQPKATFSSADNPIAKINSIWIRLLTFVYLPVFNFKLLINPNILSFDWGMDAIPRIATIFDRRNLLSIIFYSTLVYVIWRCYQLLFASCNPALTNRKSNRKVNTNLTNDAGYQTQRQMQHKSRTQRKYAYTHCKSTSSLYLINCSNASNHPGSYWKQNYFDNKEDKTYTNYSCRLTTTSNINQQTNNNNNHNNSNNNNNHNNNNSNHNNNNNNNNNSILNLNFKKSYQKECYQSHQCQLMSSSTAAEGLPQTLSLALQKVIAPVITSRSSRSSSSCSSSTTASSKSSTSSTSSTISSDSLKSYLWKPKSIASYRGCWLTNDDYLLSHIHPQHIDACVLGMSLVFLTLPFLPATNLFFYIGFVVAERLLYLPSVGFCLLVGFGISKLIDYLQAAGKCRSKQILISIMCISLCILSLRTILRNSDWKNEENLYRSAIVINPPKALGNLGSVLSSQGRYKEAEIILIKAIEMRPNMADAHFNLGILYQNQQKFKLAVLSFKSAIKFRPNLAAAYLNLGITLIALGKYQEAVQILQDGCNTDGTGVRDRISHENARISSYLQLGTLYTEQGKLHRALAIYREALHELPHNYHMRDVLHNRLGDLFSRLQQWDASERHHRLALNLQPNHASTYYLYGITLARNHNRTAEAESWFKRAILLAPNQASAHHHYGEFLTTQYRHAEAVVHKVKAAELAPNDYTLMIAAANALKRVNRKTEAELWYRKAMNLLPSGTVDGHNSNLNAILQLLRQTNKADAASYKDKQILQTKDIATLNNLANLGLTHA